MSTLGERIEQARTARGVSLARLEAEIGRSKGYMSRLVRGERGAKGGTRAESIRRLADVLNVNMEWLQDGTGPSGLEDAPQPVVPHRPHLEEAIRTLRGLDPAIIEEARTMPLPRWVEDWDVATWIPMLLKMARERDKQRR